jgi:RNA polymerase sigma-70 factor (ECF subfamily)
MDKGIDFEDVEDRFYRLILSSRQGNSKDYEEFLRLLTPILRRMVYSQMAGFSQQGAVEDVVQETLLAVHLKLHTYDISQPFMAWVRVVLKHKMIDYLRRVKMQNVSIDDDKFLELSSAPVEEEGTKLDLDKLLSHLKPPAGDIIYALKVQGVGIRELSERFKMSEGNIKIIVYRGLQKLSLLVRQEGGMSHENK